MRAAFLFISILLISTGGCIVMARQDAAVILLCVGMILGLFSLVPVPRAEHRYDRRLK